VPVAQEHAVFVLPGESSTARRRVLDRAIYREVTARLDRHFTISIVDCGSSLDAPLTQEALRDIDALIVVSSPWVDGASAAGPDSGMAGESRDDGPAAPNCRSA
jgi:MinD-like ATPase involved in chromosome partitioning or flagellar assembly